MAANSFTDARFQAALSSVVLPPVTAGTARDKVTAGVRTARRTCISNEKVAEFAHIPNGYDGATHYAPLIKRLSLVPGNKQEQCDNLDAPVLVAVGTFHSHAQSLFGKVMLEQCLTGRRFVTLNLDAENAKCIGKPCTATSREGAMFFSEDGLHECAPISGFLFFRSAYDPPVRHGILNPKPNRAFDPTWLRNVAFGSINPENRDITWVQEATELTAEQYHSSMLNIGLSEEEIAKLRAARAAHRMGLLDDDI